ncbi:MAG: hypothetical protein HYS78_02305 [Parcubacteria group bacterium]|nr:hypothetical protein [Parcubacteria group bacterium]
MAKRTGRLSGNDYLYVIARFAVRVAKSIVGGEITGPNHPYGDLHLVDNPTDSEVFWEVKASGLSSGPIICRDQLERHIENSERCEHGYVFVLYQNRKWHKGKWRYLPQRMARTERSLEKFLVLSMKEVFVVHISVVDAIFRSRPRDVRCFNMQRGPKTYLKIYPGVLRKLVDSPKRLADLGLEPDDYVVEAERQVIRFQNWKIQVLVSTIRTKYASEVSFDVAELESEIIQPA